MKKATGFFPEAGYAVGTSIKSTVDDGGGTGEPSSRSPTMWNSMASCINLCTSSMLVLKPGLLQDIVKRTCWHIHSRFTGNGNGTR